MTTTSSFNVSFVSRLSKKNCETTTIFCRINVSGKRVEFSLLKDIPKESWNSKKEKCNHFYKDFRKTNVYIDQVKSKLINIYRELTLGNKHVSPTVIKNVFLGKQEEGKSLLYLFEYHFKTQSSILSSGTVAHYKTTIKYLQEFLTRIKKRDDIYLNQIDYKFITDFEAFLRMRMPVDHQRPMSHNVIMKHQARFRKVLNMASKLDWLKNNPFDRYKISYNKVDRGYLTDLELKVLVENQFEIERLEFVKDLFVFSCYTGLAYIDVQQLVFNNIVIGIDGERWIHAQRQKTGAVIQVPLLPIALNIIEKYKDHPKSIHSKRLFPRISNQKLNSYLKEIGDICKITKNLTFHLARHTFATTVTLSNGVPIETVSKILGHTSLTTTQIYAKVLQNKISVDMHTLKEKLDEKDRASSNMRTIST